MNRFLALVLLANLVFAHLPPTPASLRRSAAHKKRLDGKFLPSAATLHRRLPDDILKVGDEVEIFDQPPGGIVSGVVNGVTITFPAVLAETPTPSSDTPSPSESPTPTPSPSSPSSDTSSPPESLSPSSAPSPSPSGTEPPPAPSDPAPTSITPGPTSPPQDPAGSTSQDCVLGLFCSPSSTVVPPSPSTSDPPTQSGTEPSPSPTDPAPTSSTPDPASPQQDPANSTSQDCGLLPCPPSSSRAPSSTGVPPSSPTSDPPKTSDPQVGQPPSTTDTPPPSSTFALCIPGVDLFCSPSSTPVSSGPASGQPPPAGSDPVATPSATGDLCLLAGINCPTSSTSVGGHLSPTLLPPDSSNPASTRPPPTGSDPVVTPSTTGDLCLLAGINCPISSTPISSYLSPTLLPPVSSNPTSTQLPLVTSDSVAIPPPFSSTTGDLCIGAGCPPSSTSISGYLSPTLLPPVSSDPASTRPPPTGSDPVVTPSTTGDLCLLAGINCPISSTPINSYLSPTLLPPVSSNPASTQPPPVTSDSVTILLPSPSTTSDQYIPDLGTSYPPSSIPIISDPASTLSPSVSSAVPGSTPSTTDASLPSESSISIPSATVVFPSENSGIPSSSTTSIPTSAPTPTSSQLDPQTDISLSFSSFSESAPDARPTDPDLPTSTSFPTAGTPNVAPSDAPFPSGLPARIVLPGGANLEGDGLDGFTLIAISFDRGLPWVGVARNPDSPGLILARLPVSIQTALDIPIELVRSQALQVRIPMSYKGPSDADKLGTLWMGYIPTIHVEALAAQIKTTKSLFYTGRPPPYSELVSHVDPSFDITAVTTTVGIPGSGGSNNGSSGGASDDSRTRENAIIGVVSASGGITLIVLGYLIYRAVQKRRELAHRRLSDPPANPFVGEAPPNRDFDQDSIGGQRRRSFYFAEDSLRGFSDHSDGVRLSPEQVSGLNRRPIAGSIGPPVMRENSLNF